MALITWNDRYSVKVAKFDSQHKKLIDMVNTLHDAMKEGKGTAVLGGIFTELLTYTQNHFAAEEKAMRTYAYPEFAQHKKEHDLLVARVVEMQKKHSEGSVTTLQIMTFLKDWLVTHIQGADMKYSTLLSSKPII